MSTLSLRRRHPLAALVVLALGLVVLGGLYAAFAPASRADVRAASASEIEEGRRLFLLGCASCHGLQGEGLTQEDGTVIGPTLVGVGAAAVDFQVGTGRMPLMQPGSQGPSKPVAYTKAEIEKLAAFVASLGPGPAIAGDEVLDYSNGDIARGAQLFAANCASCHNSSAQGGALTWGKYAPALQGIEPRHIYGAMVSGPSAMPVFNDELLTVEDKRDIIAFLKYLEAEPNPGGLGLGRLGPVSEGLWTWIVGLGALIGVAVWMGAKSSRA